MTSSFGNVVGTPRDQIPPKLINNYARTEADLTEAVNKEITRDQEKMTRFFDQLKRIEDIKVQRENENLKNLAGLVKGIGGIMKQSEIERSQKFDEKLAEDDRKKTMSELRSGKSDQATPSPYTASRQQGQLESEETAIIEEASKTATNVEEKNLLDSMRYQLVTDDFDRKGTFSFVNDATGIIDNVFSEYANQAGYLNLSSATEVGNTLSSMRSKIALAAYQIAERDYGVNLDSKDWKMYVRTRLYKQLRTKQQQLQNRWQINAERDYKTRKKENTFRYIQDAVTAYRDGGDGKIDDPEIGILKRIQTDFPEVQNKAQALNYLLRVVHNDLKTNGDISIFRRGDIEMLANTVKLSHGGQVDAEGKPKEYFGVLNAPVGNLSLQRENREIITNSFKILDENIEVAQQSLIKETTSLLENQLQEKGDLGGLDLARAEAEHNKKATERGLGNVPFPDAFKGDETSSKGTESYSDFIGTGAPGGYDVDYFENEIKSSKATAKVPTDQIRLTPTERLDAIKAESDFLKEYRRLTKTNIDLRDNPALAAKQAAEIVNARLRNGIYRSEYDPLLSVNESDLLQEKNAYSTNQATWLSNEKPNSVFEKQNLDKGADWVASLRSGAKVKFPEYWKTLARGSGKDPIRFMLDRMKATGLISESGYKSADFLDKFDLTQSDRLFLLNNASANKTIRFFERRSGPDDVEQEQKVLEIFHRAAGSPDAGYYQAPTASLRAAGYRRNMRNGDKLTVGQIEQLGQKGATNFGRYNYQHSEIKALLDAGYISRDDVFNEDTQSFMVFSLMRLHANRKNSIMGAVTEARDWRRITNLTKNEQQAVLQFFPNLRSIPMDQFQNLQSDVARLILDEVTKKSKRKK